MNTIRNDILKSTATVFQRADIVETQLNALLNKFHGNVKTKNTQAVDYDFIGIIDWSDYTDHVNMEIEEVRNLFKEIFNLRKLGMKMISKFNMERQITDLSIKMIKSWKYHFEQLKTKLVQYNISLLNY